MDSFVFCELFHLSSRMCTTLTPLPNELSKVATNGFAFMFIKYRFERKISLFVIPRENENKRGKKRNPFRLENQHFKFEFFISLTKRRWRQQTTKKDAEQKKPSIITGFDLLHAHPLNISSCLSFLITFHFLCDEADIINREYAFYIHHFDIIYVFTSFFISHDAQDGWTKEKV